MMMARMARTDAMTPKMMVPLESKLESLLTEEAVELRVWNEEFEARVKLDWIGDIFGTSTTALGSCVVEEKVR